MKRMGARHVKKFRSNPMWWIGAFVLIMSLLTAYRSYDTNQRVATVSACQSRYMQSVNAALLVRTEAADQDRNNMFALVLAVSKAETRAQSTAALQMYIKAKEDADKAREAHPYPSVQILKECG